MIELKTAADFWKSFKLVRFVIHTTKYLNMSGETFFLEHVCPVIALYLISTFLQI